MRIPYQNQFFNDFLFCVKFIFSTKDLFSKKKISDNLILGEQAVIFINKTWKGISRSKISLYTDLTYTVCLNHSNKDHD